MRGKYTKGNQNRWKNLFTSKDEAWRTPPYIFHYFDKKYKFNFDAAATPGNALTKGYFTKIEDALEQNWCRKGRRIWLNPPYSRKIGDWVKKAYEESQKGCLVACLVFARTDTKWWHDYVMKHAWKIHFIKGRIKFLTAKKGEQRNSAPAPSCLIIFKKHRSKSPKIVSDTIAKPKKK